MGSYVHVKDFIWGKIIIRLVPVVYATWFQVNLHFNYHVHISQIEKNRKTSVEGKIDIIIFCTSKEYKYPKFLLL